MVKKVPPDYANLNMAMIVSYVPPQDNIATWHTVSKRRESFVAIATQYGVPVARLIAFNFPGSVKNDHVNPDIVNWYLFNHERFRCHDMDATQNGLNYMFRVGQRVAIPHLGTVELAEPEIFRSRNISFRIRMHANLNASAVVAVDFSIFQIWDEKAGLCSFYTYAASGYAGGLIPGGWLSATLKGPWNRFTVTKAMGANQFTGPARFTSGGAGPWTKNYINFIALPPGTQTIPNPLPIDTGFTIGVGAGTSVGDMNLVMAGTKDGLLPYKGGPD